jgi:hypothetical protein
MKARFFITTQKSFAKIGPQILASDALVKNVSQNVTSYILVEVHA